MKTRVERAILLLLAAALAAQTLSALPWSRDMVVQPILRPFLIMLRPAAGAVAVGAEAPVTLPVSANAAGNPLPSSSENLAAGKRLYLVHCAVCHGPTGRGDGPVAGGALQPTDLTNRLVQQRSDAHLAAVIRNGLRGMPPYHESLDARERWQVVLYVRALAQKSP